jgi:hypothetical protein
MVFLLYRQIAPTSHSEPIELFRNLVYEAIDRPPTAAQ